MFEAGVPIHTIMAIGRWRSDKVNRYLRFARHSASISSSIFNRAAAFAGDAVLPGNTLAATAAQPASTHYDAD